MGSKWDIASQEVSNYFSSRKFLLVLGIFTIFCLGSVYVGYDNYQSSLERFASGNTYGEAPSPPELIEVFTPLISFNFPLAAGLLAIILSYDAISGEREKGTFELLLSYPVYRDEVINGKFIASGFMVALCLLFSLMASSGLAIYLTSKIPGVSDIIRLGLVWVGTSTYMFFFLGLGVLTSTALKTSWRSLIASAFILLVFVAMPLLSNLVAGFVVDSGPEAENVYERRQVFSESVSKYSPSVAYTEYSKKVMAMETENSTLRESFNSSVGNLIYLLGVTMVSFMLSYLFFMRQDI
ncbi:ABC transporter permease [Candidatus Nanohalococcus occultus]|uniref:ABC-type transport system involved in multi-copper enzyme maturation, permease component n=1 Tax=Candidatus Nanohalococcus occultus TaxID=2978047 RepID=A0ABY8CDV2_9ARCH|nr:ABC-type transport system involved in multi-copper enzyme maturation, permease component [Candidatus Nanohaloarchaeota archaeon SVXNc]